jgi:hypothetical protein
MKVRQKFGGRSVADTFKSLAGLILFWCLSMTVLFAEAPSAPAQPDSSAAKFPEASAYANTKLAYKIIKAALTADPDRRALPGGNRKLTAA